MICSIWLPKRESIFLFYAIPRQHIPITEAVSVSAVKISPVVQNLLSFSSFKNLNIKIIQSVGTITLFPHKNSFQLLSRIIQTFGKCKFPIYSMSSSISAIALNTEFLSLDMVAEKLQDVTILPDNHAPFRQEFCLKEPHQ